MNHLCLKSTPCSDKPLANLSSEVDDSPWYPGLNTGNPQQPKPPLDASWSSRSCLGICISHTSQADADACAQKAQIDCTIQGDPGGNNGGNGGWTTPQPGIPGSPVAPGTPTPPGASIKLYDSHSAECTVRCPDGTPHTASVADGEFTALTQSLADAIARASACSKARLELICFGTIEKHVCLTKEYSSTLKVTGSTPPYAFSVDSTTGALPPGLKITQVDGYSCLISGKALASGEFQFDIIATALDGHYETHAFEIDVMGLGEDTDTDMPTGQIGEAYSWQFLGAGGKDPYTFTSSSEPAFWNLTLDSDGFFHGTPSIAGLLQFNIIVKDSTGLECSEAIAIDFDAAPQEWNVCAEQETDILFGGYTGQTTPLSWSIVSGELPLGLSLEPLSDTQATLSGIPYPPGNYQFKLKTTGANKFPVESLVTVNVLGILNQDNLPPAVVNVAYSAQLIGIGGAGDSPTYTFARIGGSNWPTGLSMNAAGKITGTPTVQGTTTGILIQVTDNHAHSCNVLIDITVSPPPPVDFSQIAWSVISNVLDPVCPGQTINTSLGAVGSVESTNVGLIGGGPCNSFTHNYIIVRGVLASGANANSQCRLSATIALFNAAFGAFSTAEISLRNGHGGLMVDASTTQNFDFLWGDAFGSIVIELRCDSYSSPVFVPGAPFPTDALATAVLSSHL